MVLAAPLAACGSGGNSGDDADAGNIEEQCVPGAPFDVTGRAGVLATLNVWVNASGLVETAATAELLLMMDATQNGTDVGVVASLCNIQIPDVPVAGQDQPVHFEVGPGLIDSVADVAGSGVLGGLQTCATFESDPITIVIGARMDPPDQGILPEANSSGDFPVCAAGPKCDVSIGSTCVCDQEGDGKPGATLLATGVPGIALDEVYVDLRTTFSLRGEVFSSDDIRGEVDAALEQGILACHKANNTDCSPAEVNTVKQLNPEITQLPEEPSTFRAVRVPAATTCAELEAMKDVLFPNR